MTLNQKTPKGTTSQVLGLLELETEKMIKKEILTAIIIMDKMGTLTAIIMVRMEMVTAIIMDKMGKTEMLTVIIMGKMVIEIVREEIAKTREIMLS